MTTKSVTIYHDSSKEEKTFESVEDLVKMITDLNLEEHTGSFTIEGTQGDYVFSQMDTKTLLEYIQSIDLWNKNGQES